MKSDSWQIREYINKSFKKADLVIQPIRASRDDLIPTAKEFLKYFKKSWEKLLFILNRFGTQAEINAVKEFFEREQLFFLSNLPG